MPKKPAPEKVSTDDQTHLQPEPAPPLRPVDIPTPVVEPPAPVPRDASTDDTRGQQLKWIPRRL